MQRQITTRQSQITTFSSSPCNDRSQHFSRDHAKTDLNHATTDHIHTLTTTHRRLTLSHIAAMHTEAGSTPQAITFLATRRPPMKGGNMRCTSLNTLLLSSLFLSSSGCSGNWRKNKSGYKKFSSSEEIVWKKHSICLTFAGTLTLNTALQSFYRILGLIMIRHQLCLAVKGSAVQKTRGKSKFDYIIPHSHFDLWDSKLIFWISIWLMMRSLHTKFGYKTVDSSEDIIWTRLRHIERWQSDSKYQITYNKTSMNSDK